MDNMMNKVMGYMCGAFVTLVFVALALVVMS